ncbi:MAG: glycosyltransferase [Methanolinea sp.]|nr:glycosyltransferase [Methanolinea sp.]
MKNMKLLIISPHYKYFIKGQVDVLSPYFSQINVAIRYNPLTELSQFIPFKGKSQYFKKYSKKNLIDDTNLADNIKIQLLPMIYFVPDGTNKRIGDKLYKNLVKWIEKEESDFDLIHAHFTWPCGYAAAHLNKKLKIPTIITAHGYDIYSLPFRDDEWRDKIEFTLNNADHIITVSNHNVDFIKKLNIFKPVTVIPNGYDEELFSFKNREEIKIALNLPENKVIILSIGNLEEIKGHKYLIEAINIVKKIKKDILCIIIGAGKLQRSVIQQIRSLELENNIILMSPKPHQEIPLWMNAADLFVLPSLSEGNPTVMFEALGCGLPFVGTRVGGVPEIITSEDYGLLVEPGNAEDLAEKILIALDKEWDREKIRKYAEQFTWENIAKQIVEVYKQVLR